MLRDPEGPGRQRDSSLMDPYNGSGGTYWNPLNPPDFWNPGTNSSGGPGGSVPVPGGGAADTSYIGADIGSVAGHGAAGLSGMQIAKLALTLGIPIAQLARLLGGSGSAPGSSGSGLPPDMQAELVKILTLGRQRLESTVPVHDAAMRLAMSMSHGTQDNARYPAAISEAQQPRPQPQASPDVVAAVQQLMGRMHP